MQTAAERFLRYIKYDTQSRYGVDEYPSTASQTVFAEALAEECEAIGLSNVMVDKYSYVTAALPANTDVKTPVIAFVAHMDTSSDAPGGGVNARVVDYAGGDIKLNETAALSPGEFPSLNNYIGQKLIVTDGNTLLGADDKAGIAEILTAMEYLLAHPEIKHGAIKIAFTPDEEVGRGVDYFNVKAFGAEYAYTVDGGELGELEHETFNAARVFFRIKGKSVHPGSAYKVMVNAALIAAEIAAVFPKDEQPANTKDREGFYHLTELSGEVGGAVLSYILRDFGAEGLERRKNFVTSLAEKFNNIYGAGTVSVEIKDEYRNMAEVLVKKPEIMERARKAMAKCGITPIEKPVRGGTDGSRLSFMGLPCPNLFGGGHNFHGPYEYIPIPSMEAAVKVIVNICEIG